MFAKAASSKLLIILIILSFLLFYPAKNFDLWTIRRNFEPVEYREYIEFYAHKFSLDPDLLAALIYVESRFDAGAESKKGAVGLMQLMPSTAIWVAEKLKKEDFKLNDLNNPELNIKFGSWYFNYLYQKFEGDLIKSLAAYNAGAKNVELWLESGWNGSIEEKIPFQETDDFVRRVISTKEYYRKNKLRIFSLSNLKLALFDSNKDKN